MSGLPPVDRFTPTQIIKAAVLTCTSTSASGGVTRCVSPRLNGLEIRFGGGDAETICNAIVGNTNFAIGTGTAATAPYFIWNGSSWALASNTGFNRIDDIACFS